MVKVSSIGQTWENREITYIEIDARKLMLEKGVKPATNDNPIDV